MCGGQKKLGAKAKQLCSKINKNRGEERERERKRDVFQLNLQA